MSEAETATAPAVDGYRPTSRTVLGLTWVGLSSAIVGLITGLVMLLQRRVVQCADGTYFPEGTTDFQCFEHPLAFEGTAVVAFAISIGALIVLTSFAVIRSSAPTTKLTAEAIHG